MTTKEKIESLRDEFNKKLDDLLKEDKPGFEVGKWYKHKNQGAKICHQGPGKLSFGIGNCSTWTEAYYQTDVSLWEPMTPGEVKAALVKEAEKRGFKEGARVDRDNLKLEGFHHKTETLETGHPDYYADKDNLNIGGFCVYYKGKWAEIIKESPLMVGGEVVHYKSDRIVIHTHAYTKDQVLTLRDILSCDDVKHIAVGCSGQHKLTVEDIQKILDNWK